MNSRKSSTSKATFTLVPVLVPNVSDPTRPVHARLCSDLQELIGHVSVAAHFCVQTSSGACTVLHFVQWNELLFCEKNAMTIIGNLNTGTIIRQRNFHRET